MVNSFQKSLCQQVLGGYLAQQHKDAVPLGCDQASRSFVHVCAAAHMWISESNLEESTLTSHCTGPRDGTRVARLLPTKPSHQLGTHFGRGSQTGE